MLIIRLSAIVVEFGAFPAASVHVNLSEDNIKYLEEPYQPQGIFSHV